MSSTQTDKVKLIAFYLPQFYPFPQNDEWWGKGFTEWTNTTKASSLYEGHSHPHLPTDLGFYDLRVRETRHEQIKLAKEHGIDGFCYHYYWFSGERLLDKPVDDMLADPKSDMPFCLCWANENWTRRWDAAENEVLIAQKYLPEDDLNFIKDLMPFFKDSRYITVEGKPYLIVYRPQHLPDAKKTFGIWRQYCRDNGIGDIHICIALTHGNNDYIQYGADSGVQFPPHNLDGVMSYNHEIQFHKPFKGYTVQFKDVARIYRDRVYENSNVFRTVFPSWDNTARVAERALVVLNGTPANYEYWLSSSLKKTAEDFPNQERLVFINAWNEWAEGCHLEPDRKYGRQFLDATLRAKTNQSTKVAFEDIGFPHGKEGVAPKTLRDDVSHAVAFHAFKTLEKSRAVIRKYPPVHWFARKTKRLVYGAHPANVGRISQALAKKMMKRPKPEPSLDLDPRQKHLSIPNTKDVRLAIDREIMLDEVPLETLLIETAPCQTTLVPEIYVEVRQNPLSILPSDPKERETYTNHTFRAPEMTLEHLTNQYWFPEHGFLISKDGDVWKHSVLGQYADPNFLTTYAVEDRKGDDGEIDYIFHEHLLHHAPVVKGLHMISSHYASHNFGHFMLDMVPLIQCATDHNIPMISRPLTNWQKDLYKAIGADPKKVGIYTDRVVFLKNVIVSIRHNAVSTYAASPHHRDVFSKVLKNIPAPKKKKSKQESPKALYLSRKNSKSRMIRNRDDLTQILEKKGFKILCPEEHSFAEQVRLFSNADIIVSEFGAIMVNVVFCKPQTTVIEIITEGQKDPWSAHLCASLNLDHIVLFHKVGSEDRTKTQVGAQNLDNVFYEYDVDIDKIVEVVDKTEKI